MSAVTIAVSGAAAALPGVSDPRDLLHPAVPGADPVDPAALIGKKGLRFNDRATRLGLHLAYVALTDAGLLAERNSPSPATGSAPSSAPTSATRTPSAGPWGPSPRSPRAR